MKDSKIGVIGGSGLYSIKELEDVRELDIEIPYGKTSDSLRLGKISNRDSLLKTNLVSTLFINLT